MPLPATPAGAELGELAPLLGPELSWPELGPPMLGGLAVAPAFKLYGTASGAGTGALLGVGACPWASLLKGGPAAGDAMGWLPVGLEAAAGRGFSPWELEPGLSVLWSVNGDSAAEGLLA